MKSNYNIIINKLIKEMKTLYRKSKVSKTIEDKDFLYLSKDATFVKISDLLDVNKTIICDLSDRDGKIGLKITGLSKEHKHTIVLKGDTEHHLEDRFLYNIIFNTKKSEYSLQEQDEYFEKISIDKNEN